MANVLIISDNPVLSSAFLELLKRKGYSVANFEFRCSLGSETPMSEALGFDIASLKVKTDFQDIIQRFELVVSLHCKQLFPRELVKNVRCINIHPGLNPYNRGWFPQVFSILNGLPTGATIHEIDEQLDHGNIICQKEVPNFKWDTSIDIYNRVLQAEVELLDEHFDKLLDGSYATVMPSEEGNVNLKKDYNQLCELKLESLQPIGNTIDLLRALTHGEYQNAFFKDPKTGRKVFVSINLTPEE